MNFKDTRTLHLIAGIIFLSLAVITLRAFIFGDSLYNYRDDLEWFPELPLKVQEQFTTFDVESTRRIISIGPFLTLFNSMGLSTLITEKTIFLFTRFIIGFFPYLVTYKFLSSKSSSRDTDRYKIFVISLCSGFFYAYNPYATQYMGGMVHGFPFAYALIPLIFYFFDKALNNKGFLNIFITALLVSLAIAQAQQFLVWLPLFLLVPWFVVVIIQRIKTHRQISIAIKNSLLMTGFFLLISSYWILMALSITFTSGQAPRPDYVLTDQMLASFSSVSTLVNGFRLLGVWWPYIELTPLVDNSFWIFLTFVIPIVMLSSILALKDNRSKFYCSSFLLIFILVIFFYKGVQPPLSEFYPSLYNIPLVGWMFRVPERAGMFLPFLIMMIIGFGLKSILDIKIRGVLRYLKILPLLLIVSSISLISWSMFTGDFGGIYKDKMFIPEDLLQDFRYDVTSNSYDIPKENIVVIGGDDKVESLKSSGLLEQNESSIIISDQQDLSALRSLTPYIDKIILGNGNNGLPMQFMDENSTTILKPFDVTRQHFPSMVWSKARTNDPLHGPFHEYLDAFRISNKDQDYGKGLVFTWAQDKIKIPFEVKAEGSYDLYMRYMKNPSGGTLKVYIENDKKNETKQITTTDMLTEFVWKNIGTFNLTQGRHSLILENSYGFNAVNIFALIASEQVQKMVNEANSFVNENRIIHVLDSNSSFYNVNSKNNVSVLPESSGTFIKRFDTVFDVPDNRSQLSVQLRTKQNADSASHLKVKAIEINPIHNNTLFTSKFETSIQDFQLQDNLGGLFSLSSETENPIAGNKSLRVDVRNASLPSSGIIQSSDLIPVQENVKLTYGFTISAVDVNSLAAQAIYYDEQKKPIKTEFIFVEPRNTFEESYPNMLSTAGDGYSTPEGTRYVALQFQSTTGTEKSGYYLLDNVAVQQRTNIQSFKDFFDMFENLSPHSQKLTVNEDSLQLDIEPGNNSEWNTIRTLPIPVNENNLYNFTITIQGENINSLNSIVDFSTPDIQKNKHALVIGGIAPKSVTDTNLKILKNSTYTIATQVNTCPKCTSLVVEIGDARKEFNLRNDVGMIPKWFYFTTNLTSGNTPLKIYSDSQTYLYKMLIYPSSYESILSPKSVTYTNLKILKNSTYTIATQVNTCPKCTSLVVEIGDARKEFNLRNDVGMIPKWFYFTTNLTSGNTPLKIYSDSQTYLYKMLIYSDSYENETVNELFAPKRVSATLVHFNAVDPTHYVAKVNATKPFVLKSIEHDKRIASNPSLLVADINGNQYHSAELYQDVTGFFIPETGELDIKVEFVPQKWFYLGLVVTIITIVASLTYLVWQHRKEKSISLSETDTEIPSRRQLMLDKEHDQGKVLHEKRTESKIFSIRAVAKPQFPIFVALLLLIYVLFLLVLGNADTSIQRTVIANQIMIYVYGLLLVGAAWQFIRCLGKIH